METISYASEVITAIESSKKRFVKMITQRANEIAKGKNSNPDAIVITKAHIEEATDEILQDKLSESKIYAEEPFAKPTLDVQPISSQHRLSERNQILQNAISQLERFKETLGTPEAAMHIHLFKRRLEESWRFITFEDRNIGMLISGVEDAVRFQKWREYSPYQVDILISVMHDCLSCEISEDELNEKLSTFYKHDIDTFPSATEGDYE